MIKLKLPLQTAILYAKNDPDSAYAQAALAAYAYQEACNELDDGNNEHSYSVDAIERLAAAKLKSWGVENG